MKKIFILTIICLSSFQLYASDYISVEIDGILYNVDIDNNQAYVITFEDKKYYGDIVIPSEITFEGEKYSVTAIAKSTFSKCQYLTSVKIPNTIISIDMLAFYLSTELASINLPEGITTIGNSAFEGCTGLTSVMIPNSLKELGDAAFSGCSNITNVLIGSGLDMIGSFVFNDCSSLLDISIPQNITYIGTSAFENCTSLISLSIPNSVSQLGTNAFFGCSALSSIELPNSLTFIGNHAFEDCNGLTSVVSNIENPFKIIGSYGEKVFSQYTLENANLYVPAGTIDKYKATDGWKEFRNIIEADPSGVNKVVSIDNENNAVYDLNGIRRNHPQKGLNIIKMVDGTIRKVINK